MKAYPDLRACSPRKWFWIARFIPGVFVFGSVTFVGFWYSRKSVWNPRKKGWAIRFDRQGTRVVKVD